MSPNDADGMANSVDPDQTAPLGAVQVQVPQSIMYCVTSKCKPHTFNTRILSSEGRNY